MKNPKISVIIPIYNGGKYLNFSLKSVQNQKMKEIEIIIIDDNSSDDSIQIIHNYMRNDKRIKLIENKVNRKILFCKSIGVLNSKGKYIIELDQDDMFIRNDAFNFIYYESEKYGLDILKFRHITGNDFFQKFKTKNYIDDTIQIIKQPELKLSMFKNYICLLWGNLIRADLYKKVIYNIWPIIINYKIVFQEDYLITFFALIYAKKYMKTRNRFLFHFKNKKSASKGFVNNPEYLLSIIFAGNIFYDYYIDYNPQDFPILMNYINYLNKDLEKTKKFFPSLFNFFIGKILSNEYLTNEYKYDLKKNFNISQNCNLFLKERYNSNQSLIINESVIYKKGDTNKNINQMIIISIIIIIHSDFGDVSKLISSLNEQIFKNFEIILIFDDERKKNNFDLLLKNYSIYKKIKLIDNKVKKGSLLSITNGVMSSKGKYLIILDEKCFFLVNNALETIFEEIEKKELDILEFALYRIFPNNFMNLYKCKHFSSQFNLTQIKYNRDYRDIDINKDLLTNKLIKTKYFINIIEKYKLNEIDEIIDNYYNDILLFVLESNSHKYGYTSLVSIYKNDSDFDKIKFNDFTLKNNQKIIKDIVFYINFLFENSNNTFEEKETILKEFT